MSSLPANFAATFGDDVAEATSLVRRERRACLPSLDGREAAEASRIMFLLTAVENGGAGIVSRRPNLVALD